MTASIHAFCTITGHVVQLPYPCASRGWLYRRELGSVRHHRWDCNRAVCLIAREVTCAAGLSPVSCRNCLQRSVWRRQCLSKGVVWIIKALHNREDGYRELLGHVECRWQVGGALLERYKSVVPKSSSVRKKQVECGEAYLEQLRARLLAMDERRHGGFGAGADLEEAEALQDLLCDALSGEAAASSGAEEGAEEDVERLLGSIDLTGWAAEAADEAERSALARGFARCGSLLAEAVRGREEFAAAAAVLGLADPGEASSPPARRQRLA